MSHSDDTLPGIIEFCDREGQPCETLRNMLPEMHGCTCERGADYAGLAVLIWSDTCTRHLEPREGMYIGNEVALAAWKATRR